MYKDIKQTCLEVWPNEQANPDLFATNVRIISAIKREHLLVFAFSSVQILREQWNSSMNGTLTCMNILPNLFLFDFCCSGNGYRDWFLLGWAYFPGGTYCRHR